MKTIIVKIVFLLAYLFISSPQLCKGEAVVPADLPLCPPADKSLADYTVMDMLGRLSTDVDTLPQNHPARGKYKTISEQWPLRTSEDAAEALVAWMLNHEEEDNYRRNGLAVIQNLMNVDYSKVVDAYLAGIEDVNVSRVVKEDLALSLFDMTWDHRLMKVFSVQLLDATLMPEGPQPAEDTPVIRHSWGDRAWRVITSNFSRVGIELSDQFPNTSEGRQGLKNWIDANEVLLTEKCQAARQRDAQQGARYEFHAKTRPVE
jgi:hypothetical protein